MEKSVRDALPFLEGLVEKGIYPDIDEAVVDFKLMRNRKLGTSKPEVERMEEHKRRYGEESELPPRGTGLKKESEKQLIRDLEEYKALAEDYLRVMDEWVERAVREESDIDRLFRDIGEQDISMRGLSYRVFGYDRGDARKYIDKIEGIIAILKGEEWG